MQLLYYSRNFTMNRIRPRLSTLLIILDKTFKNQTITQTQFYCSHALMNWLQQRLFSVNYLAATSKIRKVWKQDWKISPKCDQILENTKYAEDTGK